MSCEHGNLTEFLSLRKGVSCEYLDIRDERIPDLAIGDGRGLGPFRVGLSPDLLRWMKSNNIPTASNLYKENFLLKCLKYYFLVLMNSPRPWLAKHMPENLRGGIRKILRR